MSSPGSTKNEMSTSTVEANRGGLVSSRSLSDNELETELEFGSEAALESGSESRSSRNIPQEKKNLSAINPIPRRISASALLGPNSPSNASVDVLGKGSYPNDPPNYLHMLRSPTASPSLSSLTDKISSLDRTQVNQRDLYGRSLLHLAASAGSSKLVNSLLDHHNIDTAIGDYESGWTALHRALYSGNLSCAQLIMAHSRDSIRAKDRNNETPFEIMNAIFLGNDGCLLDNTVEESDRRRRRRRTKTLNSDKDYDDGDGDDDDQGDNPPIEQMQSSRLFMFGSNANHTLGFADPDDRTNPEMVKLNRYESNETLSHTLPRDRFKPFVIKDVKISKLHTVVLTDDTTDNVYICGIPRGGRLGLGQEKSSTQFVFTKIPGFSKSAVEAVDTGVDHSVLITDSFECYTFGSNRNGQLGYPVGKTKLESSYLPRKVTGEIKRKRIIGCAASNIHTVVYTESEVFCWGKNVGQMGFLSDISSGGIPAPTGAITGNVDAGAGHVGTATVGNDTNCIIEPAPRNMLFDIGTSKIEMVCATDIATIILPAKRQEVFVFMNSVFFRIQFPVDQNLPETENFNSYSSHSSRIISSIHITKISASPNGTICAVDNVGSVYTCSLLSYFVHPSATATADNSLLRPSSLAKQIRVSTIWVARKKHLAVTDVDISDDGSVILCTRAGSVWKSTGKKVRAKSKANGSHSRQRGGEYKFNRVPFITRIRQVRCDTNFGSFGAICEDVVPPALVIDKTNLSDDMHFLVPFISSNEDRSSMRLMMETADSSLQRPLEFSRTNDTGYRETKMIPLEKDSEVSYHGLNSWVCSATEDGFKLSVSDIEDAVRGYDMILKVGKNIMPVHTSVLISRSKPLKSLIDGEIDKLKCSGCEAYISRAACNGRICIDFVGFELATVVILVYYLYTDYSLKPWGEFRKSVPKDILKSKQELIGLKLTLQLQNFWIEVYRDEQPRRDLNGDLLVSMANSPLYADVIILLKDNQHYYAHSYILKCRSGYFSALLSERWYMMRSYDSKGRQTIDLTSIPLEIFKVVAIHIYGNKEEDIFDNIEVLDTAKQFLRFVLEVMAVADELLLPKLRQICECTIKHFGKYI